MYLIALCDDEATELDQIESYLVSYKESKHTFDYKAKRFTSAEAMLDSVQQEGYTPDIMLLDIFMSGRNGIELAEEFRMLGYGIPIVFLTTSTEHALHAYGVDAIQYLVKPLSKQRFFHAMDAAVKQVRMKKDSQFVIKVAGGVRQISPDDIIYCESQKNYQALHLAEEICRSRMTAGKLWELLQGLPQFGQCGRSYIINMNHVVLVEREKIVMDNGSTIYIPRSKAVEFKKNYFAYYFECRDESKVFVD